MSRGGARQGAGRPKGTGTYGTTTKPIRIPIDLVDQVSEFVKNKGFELPMFESSVPAGLPSLADDRVENTIDLNSYLIKHPLATFLVKVTGESMIKAGIHPGDVLIVDRSIEPKNGKIVIAAVDGYLTVKRLHKTSSKTFLLPENDQYEIIELLDGNDLVIWGVVTNVLHSV